MPDGVREVVPLMDERGRQPVDDDELVTGAGSGGPLPHTASCCAAAPFDAGLPRLSQLLDQAAQMMPGDPCELPMREYHPIDHDRHSRIMPPTSKDASPLSHANS